MVKDALHRYCFFVAVGALLLVVLPGTPTSITVTILSLVLTVWLRHAGLNWYPGMIVAVAAAAGSAPRTPGILAAAYSFAAHLAFSAMIGLAATVSRTWTEGPDVVEDGGFPSLRSLSVFAVAATVFQVAFGAAFRNDLVGLMPHVAGAIFVTMVLLVVACFVLTQFPKHVPLRRAAWAVIAVVPVQIGLGIFAYLGRVATETEKASLSPVLSASMVAHVAVGAVTLATTVALALQVFYHVRPRTALQPAFNAESVGRR
jgi:hypothetical protein